MSRYYFHIRDGVDVPDLEGTELPDIGAMRSRALERAGEMVKHLGEQFWEGQNWELRVEDESGEEVLALMFSGSTLR